MNENPWDGNNLLWGDEDLLKLDEEFRRTASPTHPENCTCTACLLLLKRRGLNPARAVFGPGPEGVTCENCLHLQRFHQATSWQKCALREASQNRHMHGDHRIRWPACAKYQPAPSEEEENLKRVRPSEPIALVLERMRRSRGGN